MSCLRHINYLHVAPHRQQQQVDFVGGGGVEQFRDVPQGGRQQPTLSKTIGNLLKKYYCLIHKKDVFLIS